MRTAHDSVKGRCGDIIFAIGPGILAFGSVLAMWWSAASQLVPEAPTDSQVLTLAASMHLLAAAAAFAAGVVTARAHSRNAAMFKVARRPLPYALAVATICYLAVGVPMWRAILISWPLVPLSVLSIPLAGLVSKRFSGS